VENGLSDERAQNQDKDSPVNQKKSTEDGESAQMLGGASSDLFV